MNQCRSGNNDGRIALKDSDNNPVSANFPLNVDGDSVYSKDVNEGKSSTGTFVGDVLTLFNDYETEIIDVTGTNPKIITVHLLRPVKTNQIGIGSLTGDFSNVKISLKDLSGTVRQVVDDSADSTKHTSNVYSFTVSVFIEAVIEFHTADPVKISGMYIPKVQSRAISAIDGYVSETNTTEITLAPGGVFTGGQVDTLNYGMALVSVYSDVASATDGLDIQFRSTPTGTWRSADTYTIAAMKEKTFSVQTVRRFMRIIYTNGGTIQATFDLQTVLKPVYVKPSSHRVADSISGQDDAELVKANITAQSELTSEFENVASFRGALKVDTALVHRAGVNELFRQFPGNDTTITAPSSVDDFAITVGSTVGWTDVAPGTQLEINGELLHFHVTNIAGLVVTLDRRLDSAHAIGTIVKDISTSMNVDGTLASPQIFVVTPPPDEIWQITRIITSITSSSAMDDGRFGSRVELPFGATLRANRGGVFRTGTIWKNNGDMALDQFDLIYTDKAPAGTNGLRGRWTFTKAEFIVELDGSTNDYLAIYVQDALSSQDSFNVKAQGRIFGA